MSDQAEHFDMDRADLADGLGRIVDALVRGEIEEIDAPHVVLVAARGMVPMVQGPYPTAMEALCAAQRDADAERQWGSGLTYTVAPLAPPG